MKRFFILTLSFFLILWGLAAHARTYPIGWVGSEARQQKIHQIDAEIEQLEGMKRGFEAKALRHETQAQYLQFDNQAHLETRRHLQLADENREKAAYIQTKIDALYEERQKLGR